MKLDNFVINKLTFMKVVFSLFYAVFVYTESDKLLLPIFMAFLLLLLDIKTSVLGIIGLGSLLYLIFTGLYHFDKSWNHRWTIACTSLLVF